MKKLYKYKGFDENTNKIILNSSLYFSAIEKFNDPFDCRLSFQQKYSLPEITEYFTQLVERGDSRFTLDQYLERHPDNQTFIDSRNAIVKELINDIGVLSLCEHPDNILMWSHYSNDHKGLVFEFTLGEERSNCFKNPIKVGYKDKYDLLSYTSSFKEEAPKLMLTKDINWKYESEFRIIDLFFQGEKKFKKHELTRIVFGVCAENDDIVRMKELCLTNGFEHVTFSKAILTPGKFSLEFQEI